MATDVKLPQMGESIYEGTITKWLKKEGEFIRKDEPLYEMSTDKVDSEIPSPVTGKLVRIVVVQGSKVPIHTVVAHVEEGADGGGRTAPAAPPSAAPRTPPPTPVQPRQETPPPAAAPVVPPREGGRPFASPLVREIAKRENVDLSRVPGTGPGGRITKEDILAFIERGKKGPGTVPAPVASPPVRPAVPAAAPAPAPAPSPAPRIQASAGVQIEPMSPMRQKIAEHMVNSRRTSAHVTTVFEADLSKVVAVREREKEEYEIVYGTKLTYTPFFAMAAMHAIKEFPIINSSVDGTNIVYKRGINLGIAVALSEGLIVPVVKNAEDLSFLGLCRGINDLAERARGKKLSLDEIQGGTFTITNPGIYGGLFGTPIINQPQVAILGIGGMERRPVVIDDGIAIRTMAYLVLSFDHRVIDGAVADQFMARVKQVLQGWNLPIK